MDRGRIRGHRNACWTCRHACIDPSFNKWYNMHVRKGEKAWYGGICMPRMYCKTCQTNAFVLDGKHACCDNPIEPPDIETVERKSEETNSRRYISARDKRNLVLSQDGRCAYCLYRFGCRIQNEKTFKRITLQIQVDHFIPWSYLKTNQGELIASCQLCNQIKSNKVFDSIDSVRVMLRMKRQAMGWPNDGMLSVVWNHVRQSLRKKEAGNASAPLDVEINGTTT